MSDPENGEVEYDEMVILLIIKEGESRFFKPSQVDESMENTNRSHMMQDYFIRVM